MQIRTVRFAVQIDVPIDASEDEIRSLAFDEILAGITRGDVDIDFLTLDYQEIDRSDET